MTVLRWVFEDPAVPETYTVELNPNQMTSPFREKRIDIATTTAVDGQSLLTESQPQPKSWQFSGAIISQAHYDALLKWSLKPNRTYITDHFGRKLSVYWTAFNPEPRRSVGYYYRHNYSCQLLVLGIAAADGTVLEGTV